MRIFSRSFSKRVKGCTLQRRGIRFVHSHTSNFVFRTVSVYAAFVRALRVPVRFSVVRRAVRRSKLGTSTCLSSGDVLWGRFTFSRFFLRLVWRRLIAFLAVKSGLKRRETEWTSMRCLWTVWWYRQKQKFDLHGTCVDQYSGRWCRTPANSGLERLNWAGWHGRASIRGKFAAIGFGNHKRNRYVQTERQQQRARRAKSLTRGYGHTCKCFEITGERNDQFDRPVLIWLFIKNYFDTMPEDPGDFYRLVWIKIRVWREGRTGLGDKTREIWPGAEMTGQSTLYDRDVVGQSEREPIGCQRFFFGKFSRGPRQRKSTFHNTLDGLTATHRVSHEFKINYNIVFSNRFQR